MSTRHTTIDTSLGELTLVADSDTLIGIYFPGHWHLPPSADFGPPVTVVDDALFTRTAVQLQEYLVGERTGFELPIALSGKPFQVRVWEQLTTSRMARPSPTATWPRPSAQRTAWEVGQAVGRNPISIVVPCHRVVGKDGKLTGYAGGLTRKRLLLEREESAASRLAKLF